MCSTLAGGYLAIAARRRIHLLMGLGAGVLLGAVFFDLLPESLVVAHDQGWSVRVVLGIVVVGFLLFYLVERLLVLHACAEEDCDNQVHHHLGRFSAVGLILHRTLDGAAIGGCFSGQLAHRTSGSAGSYRARYERWSEYYSAGHSRRAGATP